MNWDDFQIHIRMGNDAMSYPQDVVDALADVMGKIKRGVTSGPVMDDNGNKVGEWKFTKEYPL